MNSWVEGHIKNEYILANWLSRKATKLAFKRKNYQRKYALSSQDKAYFLYKRFIFLWTTFGKIGNSQQSKVIAWPYPLCKGENLKPIKNEEKVDKQLFSNATRQFLRLICSIAL